jgi:hypothetical protein
MPFVVTAFIMQRWGIFCGITVACTLYYGLYERAHWRAHIPKAKLTECEGILGRVNAGRAFHHRCRSRNSNAVPPLAESFSGIPRLGLELPSPALRLPSAPNGKPNRRRFNHAPGQSNAEWKLLNAEANQVEG